MARLDVGVPDFKKVSKRQFKMFSQALDTDSSIDFSKVVKAQQTLKPKPINLTNFS
jgi:hypothetical protein